ncbi:MAG TPA: hypothetical protein VLQ93_07385, partial [Myxococcaceae bacterium]|nr:hypothetical protein [Myxococcaceae bacterium]
MATSAGGLVETLKGVATKAGTQGVRLVVDGTMAALRAADRLQEKLPPVRERVVRMKQGARQPEGERYGPDLERTKASSQLKVNRKEARPTPEARRKAPRSEPTRQAAAEKPKARRTAGRKVLHTEAPAP